MRSGKEEEGVRLKKEDPTKMVGEKEDPTKMVGENPSILKLAPLWRIRDLIFECSRRNGHPTAHP